MNKDIQRTQDKLLEAKNERARAEVRYNSHIIMVEGHRNTLRELERVSQELLTKLMESNTVVGEFNSQLQKAVELEQSQHSE